MAETIRRQRRVPSRPDATRLGVFLLPTVLAFALACHGDTKLGPRFGPASITAHVPLQQDALVASQVALAPAVLVSSEDGTPEPDIEVEFRVLSGGGSIEASSMLTGADGVASVKSWTLGTLAGSNSLVATVAALPGIAVTFTATGSPGPVAQLNLTPSPPLTTASGVLLSPQPVAQLRDTYGNPVAAPGLTVNITLEQPSAAVLIGTASSVTDASGKATFTDLRLEGPVGDYALDVSAAGLPDVIAPIHVLPGAPAELVVETQPSSTAQSGIPFANQPVIQVQDLSGNPVFQAGIVVTAAIASGGGSLTGNAQALTSVNGDASFTNLAIAGSAGTRTLVFSSPGTATQISLPITVGAGSPTVITRLTGDGQTGLAGTALPVDLSVSVEDGGGNPISGISVMFSVASGGGQIANANAISNAQGIASAGPWTLGLIPGPNSVTVSIQGPPLVTAMFTATGTAGNPSRLALMSTPVTAAVNGISLSPAPLIRLEDMNGNPIAQAGVSITASIASGGGTLGGTITRMTQADGTAAFTNLTIAGLSGPQKISFTAPSFIGVTTGQIDLSAGAAAILSISAGDNQSGTPGTPLPIAPAVQVTDVGGNPVAGVTVHFAVTSGGGNIAATTSTTNTQGVATSGVWTLGVAPGSNILAVSVAGLAGSPLSFTATGITGPPASIVVLSGNQQIGVAGMVLADSLAVEVLDASGIGVPAVSVGWTVSPGNGAVTPAAVLTDPNGRAAVTWKLGNSAGQQAVNASVNGFSAQFTATAGAGAPAQLAMLVPPTSSVSGVILTPAPEVQLKDVHGNITAQAQVDVVVAIASGGGAISGTLSVPTDLSGIATFSDLAITGSAGPRTLRFTSAGLTPATSAPFDISVGAIASVQVTPATVSLLVGQSDSLAAVAKDVGGSVLPGTAFTWASTDSAVTTVDSVGRIVARSVGSAKVFASVAGLSDTAIVNVALVPVASVVIDPPTATILQGTTSTLTATALDSIGGVLTGRAFTWTTSDAAIATVSPTGLVAGTGPGTAMIVAGSGGKRDTAIVQVTPVSNAMQLAFSSYIGGSQQDQVRDIATDLQGNIYVAGGTMSPDFPVTPGALDRTFNGTYDAYVAKLTPNGTLLWATFLGGPNYDRIYAIEVDALGFIYVAGRAGAGFPVTPGAFQTNFEGSPDDPPYGPQDGFVCKLAPDAAAIVFCSYFGTTDMRIVRDIAVDAQGGIYLGSSSDSGSFPASWFVNGAQPNRAGGLDGVVAKISPDGSQVLWATYIGGSADEAEEASIKVNAQGEAYVLYTSGSIDAPTPNGFSHTLHGPRDVYLVKLSRNGDQLLFGTFLGGSSGEHVETHELILDSQSNPVIATGTNSPDFPTTPGAFQPGLGGIGGVGFGQGTNYGGDIFVAKISADGSQLLAATYVGGPEGEGAEGIGIDAQDNVYVSGVTYSPNLAFLSGGYQPQIGGDADLIILKLTPDLKTLLYGTYLGGTDQDYGRTAIATPGGDFIVGGNILSTDWPVLAPFQSFNHGGLEGVVAKFH
ncbi:MAG: SBBP repeat-containing protein [Gemmatimonadota bacterium]